MLLLGIAVRSELHVHSRGACHFPGHFPSPKPSRGPVKHGAAQHLGSTAAPLRAMPGLCSPQLGLEVCSREMRRDQELLGKQEKKERQK